MFGKPLKHLTLQVCRELQVRQSRPITHHKLSSLKRSFSETHVLQIIFSTYWHLLVAKTYVYGCFKLEVAVGVHVYSKGRVPSVALTACSAAPSFHTQLDCDLIACEKGRWTERWEIPRVLNDPVILARYDIVVTLTSQNRRRQSRGFKQ